jgi:hypothetical protein
MKLSKKKILGYLPLLNKIEDAIEALDKYDRKGGYGDMAENFETPDRERVVEILIKMVGKDAVGAK